MKYRKEEFRIIFDPIDTPERERAKKEAVSLLENLSNTELKDDFVLAGKIKVEPFSVVCKIKVRVTSKGIPYDETVDETLFCNYIGEHINYTWLCFFEDSFDECFYVRNGLKNKFLNYFLLPPRLKIDYRSTIENYLKSRYEPQESDDKQSAEIEKNSTEQVKISEDNSNIPDVVEIPEGVERIDINDEGSVFIWRTPPTDDSDSYDVKAKKIVLSSTVREIFFTVKNNNNFPIIDTGENSSFKIRNGCLCNMQEKSLVRYVGSEDSVIIPDFITEIELWAFRKTDIVKVKIPSATKIIWMEAFFNCKHLQSIVFSEGLEEIKPRAFYGCSALEKIEFPKTLRYIGSCFRDSGLKECIFQDGIESLTGPVFSECHLEKLYVPKSLVDVEGADIPNGCEVTVDKDNPVYEIRNKFLYNKKTNACIQFAGRDDELAVIPDTALSIEKSPYNVYIPNTFPFSNKISINPAVEHREFWESRFVQFEEGRTVLPKAAFKCSYDLQKITLPQSLTTIKRQAFFNCTSLPFIEIPPSVKTIEREAFLYCTSLEKIILSPNLRKVTQHIFAECKSLKEIAIPDSVRSIEMCAFYNCASLYSISLPQKLKTIGYRAFYGCSSLKEITLPESITDIHEEAFANYKKLKTVYVYAGSYGEEFAKRLGLNIKVIDNDECI